MEIISVKETKNDDVTILSWETDDGQFGELRISYKNGNYDFNAEYISLETISKILNFWINHE